MSRTEPQRSHRPRLHITRSTTDRVVSGVAGGLADQLQVDPIVIRLSFVVLAFAGGFGIALYLACWLLSSPATETTAAASGKGDGGTSSRNGVAVALVVAGLLLMLRQVGLWFGDAIVWSVALAAFGSAVIWARSDAADRARWGRFASRLPFGRVDPGADGGTPRLRLVFGGLLILAGMATFLAANNAFTAARNVVFAVAVTASGLALILGPWVWRLARQAAEERRERVRSEERAEVAAHLHDSVLQTLALIQRTDDAQEKTSLARGQERELRAWLYGRRSEQSPNGSAIPSGDGAASVNGHADLRAAMDAMAAKVERLHHVPVEVVVVGDAPVDERLRALVDAASEATTNAAKHSGAKVVSVYAEVEPDEVAIYVRDQGAGFDRSLVPPDRRGIADSIEGRVERYGGVATIATDRADGTEVQLRMPRKPQ